MATQPLSRSDTSSMLVAVHAEEVEQQEALMDYATQAASQRVYLLLLGDLAAAEGQRFPVEVHSWMGIAGSLLTGCTHVLQESWLLGLPPLPL